MLSENVSVNVAAGVTNANAFSDSRYATLSRPARITYYAVQSGVTVPADVEVEITHGNVIVRTLSPINADLVQATGYIVGRGPKRPDDLIASGVADINDRIVIRIVNGHATLASDVKILVDIEF